MLHGYWEENNVTLVSQAHTINKKQVLMIYWELYITSDFIIGYLFAIPNIVVNSLIGFKYPYVAIILLS